MAATSAAQDPAMAPSGPSPQQALAAMKTQSGVQVELAASEPDVVDPVALRFDSQGRMWVVEMTDYPTGPVDGNDFNGRIRILTDSDGDGRFENAVTFAEGLRFPTGLQPFDGGVIVTLAGRIEFMADRDGDQRCDQREIWFEGFSEDNEQLRANHPTLGPDGIVYVANGLRGGRVRSENPRWINSDSPLDLRGKDFAFDPRGGYFGSVAGDSQFGLTIDDFGRRVGCSNRNPAFEALFTLKDLARDRWSGPSDAVHDIADSGADSVVHSLGPTWTTSHTHAGQFSAACGVTVGLGTGTPRSWQTDLVVCEPTSYVVQRQKVTLNSIGRTSSRVDDEHELLSSNDSWFRPVDTAIGIDGTLYVVDMCRAVIEHPDWAPKELQNRPDERWGNDRGRIWRIVVDGDADSDVRQHHKPESAPESIGQWIQWLSHPNPTQRQLATCHLLSMESAEVVEQLKQSVGRADPRSTEGYARMISLLAALGELSPSEMISATEHESALIRRLAIAQLEAASVIHLPVTDRVVILQRLLADEDPWVRFDAVSLTATWFSKFSPAQCDLVIEAIAKIVAEENLSDLWARRLACVTPTMASGILSELLDGRLQEGVIGNAEMDRHRLIALHHLARLAATDDRSITVINPDSTADRVWMAVAAGWLDGGSTLANSKNAVWLDRNLQIAARIAADPLADLEDRTRAIQIVKHFQAESIALFSVLLREDANATILSAVLPTLLRHDRERTLAWLSDRLSQLPIETRISVMDDLSTTTEGRMQLLQWVESQQIPTTLISAAQMKRIRDDPSPAMVHRVQALFAAANRDREAVILQFAESLTGVADLAAGRELFREHCAACHQIDGVGVVLGPDISDSRTKTPDALLNAILAPSAAIDAGYLAYQVLTVDGQALVGALVSDEADRISIRLAGGELKTFRRDEVEEFRVSGVSLMPEGFERNLTIQQMRNLLGFLKGWRYMGNQPTIELDRL